MLTITAVAPSRPAFSAPAVRWTLPLIAVRKATSLRRRPVVVACDALDDSRRAIVGQDDALASLDQLLSGADWKGNLVLDGRRGLGRRRIAQWVASRLATTKTAVRWVTASVQESEDAENRAEPLDTRLLERAVVPVEEVLDRLEQARENARNPNLVYIVDLDALPSNKARGEVMGYCLPGVDSETAQWILLVTDKEIRQAFPRACRQTTVFITLHPLNDADMRNVLSSYIVQLTAPEAFGDVMEAAVAIGNGSPGDAMGKVSVLLDPNVIGDQEELFTFLLSLSSAKVRAARRTARAQLVSDIMRNSQKMGRVTDIAWHTYLLEFLAHKYFESFAPAMEEERATSATEQTAHNLAMGVNLSIAQAHESITAGVHPQLVWDVVLLKVAGLLPAAPRKLRHNSKYQF